MPEWVGARHQRDLREEREAEFGEKIGVLPVLPRHTTGGPVEEKARKTRTRMETDFAENDPTKTSGGASLFAFLLDAQRPENAEGKSRSTQTRARRSEKLQTPDEATEAWWHT